MKYGSHDCARSFQVVILYFEPSNCPARHFFPRFLTFVCASCARRSGEEKSFGFARSAREGEKASNQIEKKATKLVLIKAESFNSLVLSR